VQNSPLPCKVQWINIYFPHNVLQTVYVVSACELSICYYIFFWFFYNVNIHKLWEHILKLIVPSIILASPSTITNYCTIQYFKLKTCTTIGPWRHHRVSNEKQLVRRYRWWPVANQFCLTELSICYYIFFWFFYNVNIHKLWEHILKLIVPSIILASPSTILFVVREITRKWFIFKRLFPAYFCSWLFQYEERYVFYYAN
jgi:hypothetical protein